MKEINVIAALEEVFGPMEVITLDVGDTVLCDLCNENWTDNPASGGFIFGSTAVCPKCAPKFEATIVECGEERYISARCPEDKSFANWVREDLR